MRWFFDFFRPMKIRHNISDFIFRHDIPVEAPVYDAILHYHLLPIHRVEQKLGCHVMPTLIGRRGGGGSVYRHPEHERERGRSGKGMHTFMDWKGAGDYTIADFTKIEKFLNVLVKETDFTRLCYYPNHNFVHCDYRADTLQLFVDEGKGWQYVDKDDFFDEINEKGS